MDQLLNLALVAVVGVAALRMRLTSSTYSRTIWQRRPNTPIEPAASGVVLVPDVRRAFTEAAISAFAACGLAVVLVRAIIMEGLPGPLLSSVFGLVCAALLFAAYTDIATYRTLRRLEALATVSPTAITHHRNGRVIPIERLAVVKVRRPVFGAESVWFHSTTDTVIRVSLRHAAMANPNGPGKPEIRRIVTALPRSGRVIT